MKFYVVEAGGVGAVIRPPRLTHHLLYFREIQDDLTHFIGHVLRFFERYA